MSRSTVSIQSYADARHRQAVVQLWETVFGYETAHNAPTVVIGKKLEAEDGLFFVATVEEEVVGTVLAGYDGHRGWLYSVAVHPSRRRVGLGTELIRHAEQSLGRLGCMKIVSVR